MPKPQIEDGYTRIANELLGEMVKLHLSGNEWSIVHCVMRKTWGWNKKQDKISLTQFVKETGFNRSTVNKNIKSLVAKQILVAVLQPSGNIYQIQKDYSKWTSCRIDTSCRFATTPVAEQQPKLVAVLQHTKEKKETIQKKRLPIKEDLLKIDIKRIALDYKVPETFVVSCWDDVMNYCYGHDKRYSDWSAVLRNFVKSGAIKLKQEVYGKSTIAFIKTE